MTKISLEIAATLNRIMCLNLEMKKLYEKGSDYTNNYHLNVFFIQESLKHHVFASQLQFLIDNINIEENNNYDLLARYTFKRMKVGMIALVKQNLDEFLKEEITDAVLELTDEYQVLISRKGLPVKVLQLAKGQLALIKDSSLADENYKKAV